MPMNLLMPIVMVVLVALAFVYRAKMTAKFQKDFANYTLADIAALLGLQVSEGPPTLNMMNVHAEHARQAKEGGGLLAKLNTDGTRHSTAVAQGERWGRAYRFEYLQRTEVETKTNIVLHSTTTTTEWFGMSLAAALSGTRPRFEVHVTNPAQYCEPKLQTALPPQKTGLPSLDGVLTVKCDDPALAAALAPALVPLMSDATLHILCTGTEVKALSTRYTYGTLLMNIAALQKGLEHIACILEGRSTAHLDA